MKEYKKPEIIKVELTVEEPVMSLSRVPGPPQPGYKP